LTLIEFCRYVPFIRLFIHRRAFAKVGHFGWAQAPLSKLDARGLDARGLAARGLAARGLDARGAMASGVVASQTVANEWVKIESAANESQAGKNSPSRTEKKNLLLSIFIESISLFILYAALSPPVAMPLYNAIIFHPIAEKDGLKDQIKAVEHVFHCTFQDIHFQAPDGERLHGWYFAVPRAKKTILISHGNAGCIQHHFVLYPLLLQSGCSVFMYDYEGFGESTGSPNVTKVCQDAVASFDYLTNKLKWKPSDVIIYGESVGAAVTSELSKKRLAGGIILQSPFTSLPDVGADKIFFIRFYPEWLFPTPTLSNLDIMKLPHPPLLIIHGMKDETLPYRYSEQIMANAAFPKTLVLLPNAGHTDVYKTDLNLSIPALDRFIAGLP
jgi:uncharacterized protein